ncbi:unnamed protein product [Sphenostylis stenocarpa]|uniref:Uncharacterized protein n=1 Tax=Sphenostylis stenocarpa TaxID=92480 RepID=A0AA86VT99_9FABA|nr:unnamed protein product [Sphenostylis stenocarpa]
MPLKQQKMNYKITTIEAKVTLLEAEVHRPVTTVDSIQIQTMLILEKPEVLSLNQEKKKVRMLKPVIGMKSKATRMQHTLYDWVDWRLQLWLPEKIECGQKSLEMSTATVSNK